MNELELEIREEAKKLFEGGGFDLRAEIDLQIHEGLQTLIAAKLYKGPAYVGRAEIIIKGEQADFATLDLVPEFQDQGYYTYLCSVTPDFVRNRGANILRAHAHIQTPARDMYLRTGFEPHDDVYVSMPLGDGSKPTPIEQYAASKS